MDTLETLINNSYIYIYNMIHYGRLQEVKDAIGERGDTNNKKIHLYMNMADDYINSKLINVNSITVPINPPSQVLVNLATSLSISYFYKFESGDEKLSETSERNIDTWFDSSFIRPKFTAASGDVINRWY